MTEPVVSGSSPTFATRPRTANLKQQRSVDTVGLPTPNNRYPGASSATETPASAAEGSVLWSEDGGVPSESLARPHTSNPRYTERSRQVETPAATRDSADTASRQSSNPGGTAVLWASDATDITSGLLARPTTSNPWLARFLDGVPDAKTASQVAAPKKGEILWSDKEINDWRLLARPHASNPVYEAAQQSAADAMVPAAPSGQNVSEILWSSDTDPVSSGSPSADHRTAPQTQQPGGDAELVAHLRAVVDKQRRHIGALETQVAHLQAQLVHQQRHPAEPAAALSPPAELQRPTTSTGTGSRRLAPMVAPMSNLADHHVLTSSTPTSPTGFLPVTDERSVNRPVAVDGTRRYSNDLPVRLPQLSHNEQRRQSAVSSSSQPDGTPHRTPHETQRVNAPLEAGASVGGSSSVEAHGATIGPPAAAVPISDPAVGSATGTPRFVTRLRDSAHAQRPTTATAASMRSGAGDLNSDVETPRPVSAPAFRGGRTSDAGEAGSLPTTYAALASQHTLGDESIREAYGDMCTKAAGSSSAVSKKAFKRFYMAQAKDYGVDVTAEDIDRKLAPFRALGSDLLSYDEFAVLYLELQRW